MKTCVCGLEFEPASPRQIHCSRRCSARAARMRRKAGSGYRAAFEAGRCERCGSSENLRTAMLGRPCLLCAACAE